MRTRKKNSLIIWNLFAFLLSLPMIQSVCIRVGCWINIYWTSAPPLSHTEVFVTLTATNGAQKGRFLNVIFYIQNFATFGFYWKINATKRPRRLYYISHNTLWRGLTELLISVERAMRRPRMWGKRRKVFSHVFFVSIHCNLLIAEAGRAVDNKTLIYKGQ